MYIPILQTIFKSYIFTSNKSGTLIEACCFLLYRLIKPMDTKTRLIPKTELVPLNTF